MGDQREKFKNQWIVLADILDFSLWSPHETKKIKVVQMSSNFERVHKVINQAYAENFMWNPKTCQDACPVAKMIWSFLSYWKHN